VTISVGGAGRLLAFFVSPAERYQNRERGEDLGVLERNVHTRTPGISQQELGEHA
jgi:hypothetical protein